MKKILSYVLLAGLTSACTEQEVKVKDPETKLVRIFTVEDKSLQNNRVFPGIVEAKKYAVLSFKVPGSLSELTSNAGMEFTKGQLLAKLDDKDFLVNLEQAKASYDLAESELKRMKELSSKGLVAKSRLDQVSANFKTAKANLTARENELDYSQIRAPFNLSVASIHVENFEQISPTQPILTVHDVSSYNISIQVPQNLMANVKDDVDDYQPEVSFSAKPNLIYKAKLSEWVTNTDSASDTYKVLFSIDTPEELNILPGMTAKVKIDLNQVMGTESSSILVPLSAVFSSTSENSSNGAVWVVADDSTLVKREVKLGRISGQEIQILSGLSNGEKVVTAGVERLTAGLKVSEWSVERGL